MLLQKTLLLQKYFALQSMLLNGVKPLISVSLTDICVRAIIRHIREKKEAAQNILYDDAIRLEAIQ